MVGLIRWSGGRCVRNLKLTIRTNGICTTQHLPQKMTHINSYGTLTYIDHLIIARRLHLIIINKKKRTYKIVDFAVPADHRMELKEYERKDKYLHLAGELKKNLGNMKGTIIPIGIGAFGTETKVLFKWLEDLEVSWLADAIQTTSLLRTARILRRVLKTWGDLVSLKLEWKNIRWTWCKKKNSQSMWWQRWNHQSHSKRMQQISAEAI